MKTLRPYVAPIGIFLTMAASLLAEEPKVHDKQDQKDKMGAVASPSQYYRVGAGDVLQVMVWHEPDASMPTPAR